MTEDFSRRPIASRNTKWAAYVTRRLVQERIPPNRISMGSVVAAAGAGAVFALAGYVGPFWAGLLLVAGAALTQLRLLCNLFDGLVAVDADAAGDPDQPAGRVEHLFLGPRPSQPGVLHHILSLCD